MPAKTRYNLLIIGCMLSAWASPGLAYAEDAEAQRAIKIKAAFVLNFIKYTTWPDKAFKSADSPLIIAVVGPDTLGSVLDGTVRGQKVNEHLIEVRRFNRPEPPSGDASHQDQKSYEDEMESYFASLRQSHLLFVTEIYSGHLQQVLRRGCVGTQLSVGDVPDFAERGGMIGLVQRDGKIAFDVNLKRIQRSRLAVSSKILSLGRTVEDKETK